MSDPPAPLRSLRPELPAVIDEFVLSMLAKDPSERIGDCRLVALKLLSAELGG